MSIYQHNYVTYKNIMNTLHYAETLCKNGSTCAVYELLLMLMMLLLLLV